MSHLSLSIIIPVYNAAAYLGECLDSIEANAYPDIEIILVDDGSDDGSGAICDSYQQRDSRIRVIHQPNRGQSAARNAALTIATGHYLTFVDADDMIQPHTIEANMRILNNDSSIDILQYPFTKSKDEWKDRISAVEAESHSGTEHLLALWLKDKQITNYVWNKFFKHRVFQNLRFREGMYYEDRYLMCDLLKTCRRFYFSPHGYYFYRTHGSQTTQKAFSPRVLQSLITADLHIYNSVASYKSLRDVALERYNNCLYYYQYARNRNWEIAADVVSGLKASMPSIAYILSTHVPWGIKIKCTVLSILGIDSLSKLTK